MLVNRTVDGREQVFEDLVFHGGPGTTLEMRVFARGDLIENFAAAGFDAPRLYEEDAEDFGILWGGDPSRVMAVRAPKD